MQKIMVLVGLLITTQITAQDVRKEMWEGNVILVDHAQTEHHDTWVSKIGKKRIDDCVKKELSLQKFNGLPQNGQLLYMMRHKKAPQGAVISKVLFEQLKMKKKL